MGLFNEIAAMLGGDNLQRFAGGQANFENPDSEDHQRFQQMVSQADPAQLQQAFTQAARQMNAQEYAEHVTPGMGGTNPLGSLGSSGLGTLASMLLTRLTGTGGYDASRLLTNIPGLRTTDPNQMDEHQVASLAQYAQQKHPDIFGQVAAQVGQQQPSLLHSFLGKAGLALGAAALASHFIGTK